LKSLCFVHNAKAQLPELQAYCNYFKQHYKVAIATANANLQSYDIVWFFMGYNRYQAEAHQFIVHEYASLSTPPLARLKDKLKVALNPRPHLRVFQNKIQHDLLNFNDNVAVRFRDMGFAEHFVAKSDSAKACDVIYVGAMDKSRQLEKALDSILRLKPQAQIWMVGLPAAYLQRRYRHLSNIQFIGAVANSQIPQLLHQARFGLNFVPDEYPYQFQTSTKLLEYAACGLPVVGNMTPWLNRFLATQPLPYYQLDQLNCWPELPAATLPLAWLPDWRWQQRIAQANFETILP
jgi:glycosyltransferase involved in cell wall biosynthesis